MLGANDARKVVLLGYGTDDEAGPLLTAAREIIGAVFPVRDCLRVHDGRWWPVGRHDPPPPGPEGHPYDISATVVAAQATLAGVVVHADRDGLARVVAATEGEQRARMIAATRRAERELLRGHRDGERLDQRGLPFVVRALGKREPLTDQEAARLSLFLTRVRVFGEARARTSTGPAGIGFWADLTRRAVGRYVAAPASLLAYAAYLESDGALAHLALDRADEAVPGYPVARALRELLNAGIPARRTAFRFMAGLIGSAHVNADTAGQP